MTANISQHVVPRPRSYRARLQSGRITPTGITAALGVSTLVAITMLGFFYLQQVLHTASQGTDVHALESKLIDMKEKQRELELEGARLRSLQNVEEHVKKLHLAPADHVTYLNVSPDHVAALSRNAQ